MRVISEMVPRSGASRAGPACAHECECPFASIGAPCGAGGAEGGEAKKASIASSYSFHSATRRSCSASTALIASKSVGADSVACTPGIFVVCTCSDTIGRGVELAEVVAAG